MNALQFTTNCRNHCVHTKEYEILTNLAKCSGLTSEPVKDTNQTAQRECLTNGSSFYDQG